MWHGRRGTSPGIMASGLLHLVSHRDVLPFGSQGPRPEAVFLFSDHRSRRVAVARRFVRRRRVRGMRRLIGGRGSVKCIRGARG